MGYFSFRPFIANIGKFLRVNFDNKADLKSLKVLILDGFVRRAGGITKKNPVYLQRDKYLSKRDAGRQAKKRDGPGVSGTSGQPTESVN